MASGKDKDFFDEQLRNSNVKSQIVSSYFESWARVMIPRAKAGSKKLGYIDFFSGPGKYADGSNSTPLLILNKILGNKDLKEMLIASFFDQDKKNIEKLNIEIKALNGIKEMKFKPTADVITVNSEVVEQLRKVRLVPSLIFIDPFGYKSISLEFIGGAIKNWGCDCIFFFNYNRINMAIHNEFVRPHMDLMFGKKRVDRMREQVGSSRDFRGRMNPIEREKYVMQSLVEAIEEINGRYVIPFKFIQEGKEKTSHYLVFVTKHQLGLTLMKSVMAGFCPNDFGVPTYTYNPNPVKTNPQIPLYSEEKKPTIIENLAEELMEVFKGRTLSREQIYDEHNVGRPFLPNNYKTALLLLEEQGKIGANPSASKRPVRKGERTMANEVIITFK